jgi:hypothetical protein
MGSTGDVSEVDSSLSDDIWNQNLKYALLILDF